MKIRPGFWRTLPLFLPFIMAVVLMSLTQGDLFGSITNFAIANFLFILYFSLVFSYQAYLLFQFDKADLKSSVPVKINALIPVICFWLYLCFVGYATFFKAHDHKMVFSPVNRKELINGWMVIALLLYGLINFLFVNNQYVLWRIKRHEAAQQEQLEQIYWLPMRVFVRAFLWLFLALIIVTFITDVLKIVKA